MDFGSGPGLWPALEAVCHAVVDPDQGQWTVAVTAAKNLGGPTENLESCLDRAARGLLQRALAWHERNPGRQPVVKSPEANKTACSFIIEEVLAVDKDLKPIEKTSPSGPTAGGTPFALIGQGLDDPTEVRIAGRAAEIVSDTVDPDHTPLRVTIIVRTPKVDQAQAAHIDFRNRAGKLLAPATFQYK
jgi:hypothetical protein